MTVTDNSSGNLYKLCGYGNPSTKSYAASFKEQKNKTFLAVAGGKVQLTEGGVAHLKRRDELPLRQQATKMHFDINDLLKKKLGLMQTGFGILGALVADDTCLTKVELANKVGTATKSFGGSLTFLTELDLFY
ncbi:hypothetical protein IV203_029013 [Nitzschia inconspicua]|uniref:Uncharacterized protein n=1 Tax=Nitzschia inconspicua TaxID=303405 RepID=A0A9K3Q0A6_9STRA|nr:hypothetical protein IV203_029013 [Nitzschia inconspicua]